MDPDAQESGRRQDEVRGDIGRLERHAESLSEVWTGLRMDGPDIVVLLTDPDAHEEEPRALVEHPDRLHVRRSRHTRTHLDEVHRETVAMIGHGTWKGHSPGLEHVTVTLRSGQLALARALVDRFGDAIEVRLGRHRFPLAEAEVRPTLPVPVATIELPGVLCTVRCEKDRYEPGEDIRGRVEIENDGPATLAMQTGTPAVGVLLDADGGVVGSWSGFMAQLGGVTTIEPGGSAPRRFIAGSDTLDPRRGAALPPGDYRLVVPIAITARTPDGDAQDGTIVTEPVTLRIRAAVD